MKIWLTESCYDVRYRIEGGVCWCGVGELICVTVDAAGGAIGGEPIEFGGHCCEGEGDVCIDLVVTILFYCAL